MKGFTKGFKLGDNIAQANNQHIIEGHTPRYINVWNQNDGREYTIGDNGERRERQYVNGSIRFGMVQEGDLSYDDINFY